MGKIYVGRRRIRIKFSFNWFLVYMIMLGLVAFTSLPIIYMISTAFKPIDELFLFPPRFFVRRPTIENFKNLLTAVSSSTVPFTRYVFNSLFITIVNVIGTVLVCSMGAYALVKHKLPGADIVFKIIVGALMFPVHVTQIPTYMVVNSLGLINTYSALIIPKLAVAYNFFLMKQFIEQLPDPLLESARIDGATEWTVFWRIVMPSVKPAICTLVVFSFVSNWNDYFSPLVFITSEVMKTLPLAIQTIGSSTNVARAGAIAAATLLTTAPTIITYVVMQSRVMQTMVHSGIKS